MNAYIITHVWRLVNWNLKRKEGGIKMEGYISPADIAVLSGQTGNRNNDGLFGDNGAW